ncbi:MAG: hypothetical protein JXA25_04720 [Anaerolineales bacterium]|nr:hypothetical protein [Anaerolineales bacterium]
MIPRFTWRIWLIGSLGVGIVVALLDPVGLSFQSASAFVLISAFGFGLVLLAWRWLKPEPGNEIRSLIVVLAAAVLLRLAVSLILVYVLPAFGYSDEPVQQAGYVFYDAYARDQDAWQLARSEQPLWRALAGFGESDQYGGLLFLSASIYRFLSPSVHHPLLVAILSGFIGSLAVLFTWKAARLNLGAKPALFAAWVVALYPDAVMLSSSQMREAYLISGFAAAIMGYMWVREGEARKSAAAFLAAVVLLSISPPFLVLTLAIIGLAWVWEGRKHSRQTGWLLIIFTVLVLVAFVITVLAWSEAGIVKSTGLASVRKWLERTAEYQILKLERGSGWVQKMFDRTPEWTHIPMATVYGLIQPFFPGGLMSEGALVWRILVTWRGLGWMILITFLVYAPIAALKTEGVRSLNSYLVVIFWLTALLVSFRAAGDLWDNPRYRTVLLAAQAIIAAWSWAHARQLQSPWLLRTGLLVGFINIMFIIWYAGRGQLISRLYFDEILRIIAVFTVLFLPGSWLWDWLRKRKQHRLTK